MKLTVLTDNNTLIDRYYLGEPGLSFYIEDEDKRILFDTGYSDAYLKNAQAMGIDLNKTDVLVLSHGHNDHTGGLRYIDVLKQNVEVYCHPLCDEYKEYEGLDISSPVKFDSLPENFTIHRTREAQKISRHITFLGEIPRTVRKKTGLGNDELYDDTAMVYEGKEGIFIITACSHSGIENIIEYAKKVTGISRITGIIGGFHMQDDDALNEEICTYLKTQDIGEIYPCHCTDLKARMALGRYFAIHEIGVSYTLEVI